MRYHPTCVRCGCESERASSEKGHHLPDIPPQVPHPHAKPPCLNAWTRRNDKQVGARQELGPISLTNSPPPPCPPRSEIASASVLIKSWEVGGMTGLDDDAGYLPSPPPCSLPPIHITPPPRFPPLPSPPSLPSSPRTLLSLFKSWDPSRLLGLASDEE